MKFLTKIDNEEKKRLINEALTAVETSVQAGLLVLGMDPNTFDENSFVADPSNPRSVDLARELAAWKMLKNKLAETE